MRSTHGIEAQALFLNERVAWEMEELQREMACTVCDVTRLRNEGALDDAIALGRGIAVSTSMCIRLFTGSP